jgi:hypothetical protein
MPAAENSRSISASHATASGSYRRFQYTASAFVSFINARNAAAESPHAITSREPRSRSEPSMATRE